MTKSSCRVAVAIPVALAALALQAGPASADRVVRVSGGIHIGGSAHVRVRPYSSGYRQPYRPHGRVIIRPSYPNYYWGGGLYFGVRYAEPPPPQPCYEGCGAVYYAQPTAVAVAPEPPLPSLALGVFAGGTELAGGDESSDIGLLGRFRLTSHLELEGEIAKSELFDGQRIDRTMGGALLYDLAPWSRASLYLLGGAGVGATEISGDVSARHVYGEVGIGVDWRLADRVSVIADLRAGERQSEREDRVVALGGSGSTSLQSDQEYSRGRLGLLVSF